MSHQRGIVWSVLLVTLGLFLPSHAQEANKVSEFMRAKLTHSQRVLEGLTIEDFDLIAKHAQEMSLLSQAATW